VVRLRSDAPSTEAKIVLSSLFKESIPDCHLYYIYRPKGL
jgi:hypothetical protein